MRNIVIISDREFDDNKDNSEIIKKFLDETVKMNPENCSVTICNVGAIWHYVYSGNYLYLLLPGEPDKRFIRHEDEVVAFWDGKNPGTKHLIDQALKYHKKEKVFICRYDKNA